MQTLIVANGIEPSQASQSQLSGAYACVQQLTRDPRVQTIFGTTGRSTGCAMICEVESLQEAQQLAGFLQIGGFPDVRIHPIVSSAVLQAGLQAALKAAPVSPRDGGSVPQAWQAGVAP